MVDKNLIEIESNSFVKESIRILHEAYMSKKLILFVGAGADAASGMPLWPKAVKEFCKHLNIQEKDADNLRVPQYYYNSRGKKEYVELSREIFCYNKELPINELQKKIVDFSVHTIITTNYTNFLEREMDNRGYIYRVISQDKDLPYTKNENLIIKMHGDFEHDNFVLKEDDYLNYSNNFRLIETFIKSIIAKNVVLFIGYSFNDPDVKQLFSWVKNILGNDFQQAYMLNGYDDYDKNVFEYYKHLGVNVIYTKKFGDDRQKALIDVMDIIKNGNMENISNAEVAANYFLPYLNLNHILNKYLNKGFQKCNLIVSGGILKSSRIGGKREKAANELLIKICEGLTREELSFDDSYDVLACVLRKSQTYKIELTNLQGQRELIDVPHKEDQLLSLIMEFNYKRLREDVDYKDFLDKKGNGQFYLKQAYVYYVLEDYVNAYVALCRAAEEAFHMHQYYIYFIAQFNKLRIKDLSEWGKIPQEIHDKIVEDMKRIDLDKIILDTSDLSSNDSQALNDIASFQLHYSLFQDIYRKSEKVKEQQETAYTFFSGVPDYFTMQWLVKDYYQYITGNFLMVDRYIEAKEILTLYIKSILGSVSTPDKKTTSDFEFHSSGNVHASAVGEFELFLMIKYMSEEGILNLLSQYGMETIPLERDCNNYLKTVLDNLYIERGLADNNELWNCIVLSSYINPDYELVEAVIDCIADKFNCFIYRTHHNTILKFLVSCYNGKRLKPKLDNGFKIEDYAIGRFLKVLVEKSEKENEDLSVHAYRRLMQECFYIFNDYYKESYDKELNGLICDSKSLIIASIYPYCGEQNKKRIKEFFENWKGSITDNSCEIYFEAVMNNIMEPNNNFETLIFDNIDIIEKRNRGVSPNEYKNILATFCNLLINNKIIDVERFKQIIRKSNDEELKFLCDEEGFDYDNFDLEWLNLFRGGLLKEIAQNKVANTNISKIFAEKMENDSVSNKLLKLYFKYFVNITDMN